ncbi:MAG: hypothetical protein QXP70_05785, partial [Methanomassiliicoccales archaeon]
HRIGFMSEAVKPEYFGGPLWKTGYSWLNVYWGNFFTTPSSTSWMNRVDRATADIEKAPSYSGGLSQYNVGIGNVIGRAVIPSDPPGTITDAEISTTLQSWISSGKLSNLGTQGAYNIFFPPGVSVSLYSDYSCSTFCDYHNSANGAKGPFYTVEPYPCTSGCNQCTSDIFDTLTSGLSEEMVELKTDMDPGTGWLIGNLELCDYCDEHYVCNRLATGEYVNAWYDMKTSECWKA